MRDDSVVKSVHSTWENPSLVPAFMLGSSQLPIILAPGRSDAYVFARHLYLCTHTPAQINTYICKITDNKNTSYTLFTATSLLFQQELEPWGVKVQLRITRFEHFDLDDEMGGRFPEEYLKF